MLTPFCETEGLYFSNAREPEDALFDFNKELVEYQKAEHPDRTIIDLYGASQNMTERLALRNRSLDEIRASRIRRIPRHAGRVIIRFEGVIEDDDI
jgi:hypothetical protein